MVKLLIMQPEVPPSLCSDTQADTAVKGK